MIHAIQCLLEREHFKKKLHMQDQEFFNSESQHLRKSITGQLDRQQTVFERREQCVEKSHAGWRVVTLSGC